MRRDLRIVPRDVAGGVLCNRGHPASAVGRRICRVGEHLPPGRDVRMLGAFLPTKNTRVAPNGTTLVVRVLALCWGLVLTNHFAAGFGAQSSPDAIITDARGRRGRR